MMMEDSTVWIICMVMSGFVISAYHCGFKRARDISAKATGDVIMALDENTRQKVMAVMEKMQKQ